MLMGTGDTYKSVDSVYFIFTDADENEKTGRDSMMRRLREKVMEEGEQVLYYKQTLSMFGLMATEIYGL